MLDPKELPKKVVIAWDLNPLNCPFGFLLKDVEEGCVASVRKINATELKQMIQGGVITVPVPPHALCDHSDIPASTGGQDMFLCINDGACRYETKASIIAALETTTTFSFNAATCTLTYVNEDGVVVNTVLPEPDIAVDSLCQTLTFTKKDGTKVEFTPSQLVDKDGDTSVIVESGSDDDKICFEVEGKTHNTIRCADRNGDWTYQGFNLSPAKAKDPQAPIHIEHHSTTNKGFNGDVSNGAILIEAINPGTPHSMGIDSNEITTIGTALNLSGQGNGAQSGDNAINFCVSKVGDTSGFNNGTAAGHFDCDGRFILPVNGDNNQDYNATHKLEVLTPTDAIKVPSLANTVNDVPATPILNVLYTDADGCFKSASVDEITPSKLCDGDEDTCVFVSDRTNGSDNDEICMQVNGQPAVSIVEAPSPEVANVGFNGLKTPETPIDVAHQSTIGKGANGNAGAAIRIQYSGTFPPLFGSSLGLDTNEVNVEGPTALNFGAQNSPEDASFVWCTGKTTDAAGTQNVQQMQLDCNGNLIIHDGGNSYAANATHRLEIHDTSTDAIKVTSMPNTLNQTAATPALNFLYTDAQGCFKSGAISSLGGAPTVTRCTGPFDSCNQPSGWLTPFGPVHTTNSGTQTLQDWRRVGSAAITSPACVTDASINWDSGDFYYRLRRMRMYIWLDYRILINGGVVWTYTNRHYFYHDKQTGGDIPTIPLDMRNLGSAHHHRTQIPASSSIDVQIRVRYNFNAAQSSAYGRLIGGLRSQVNASFSLRNQIIDVT